MPFPRNPRFQRAENFPHMELTGRDTAILKMVNRHRFLRSHQIVDLVSGSRQQVLRRLQKLYHHGYLERPGCQLDYYRYAGSRSIAYGLASRGAAHLRRVENISFARLDWTSRNRGVKRLFLEHALMVSDIMVALEIACRNRPDIRLLIEDEISLPAHTQKEREPFRWTVTAPGSKPLSVIPDRVFVLEFAGGDEPLLCLLEADRGTMPVARAKLDTSSIKRKFQAYARTWRTGLHRSRFGTSRLRVLTVTTSETRCQKICEAAFEINEGRGLFLQTFLTPHISSKTCFGGIWRTASKESESLA